MRKIEAYVCSKCETIFKDKREAASCERYHGANFEVIEARFEEGREEPCFIKIKFSNRNKKEYVAEYVGNGCTNSFRSCNK